MTYLKSRGSTLVLNEPRTGKTPTMIAVLNALVPKTTLIVTPSSLTYNWSKEIEIWSDLLDSYVYSGTPKQREKIMKQYKHSTGYKVFIVSKDTLKKDKELQDMVFSVMIVDEAHFLRNWKTAQSQAINKVTAKVKYALTGTPAVKHGSDVYGLLHFINPEAFPSYWQFTERYFNIEDNGWGKDLGDVKSFREKELKDIMAVNSVQRKRKDVMKWLPSAQYQTLNVKMEGKQLKLYEQMLETFIATDDESETEIDTMNVLSQLIRLRQLCLDPRLLGFDAPSVKTKALLEFAEDNTEPFIVMTTFSSYFKIIKPELEKLGKKVGIIDGSISQKHKFKTAEDFQKGHYDILLCNIIAAGTGFTLDRADTVIFLDKDFNPANNEQAQDRIVPTTKERYHSITVISLVCDGSIDARVNEIIDRKEDLTKIINHPKELLV
jgi:SNF2 family DNA or RNA helicase